MDRQAMLKRIVEGPHDLLVIGGGITGAGVAREAALRGLGVALVEARDFAFATSSRSTKLIHGGLRYLKNFEFRLVREAVEERQHLLHMAPHLVKATPFLFPVYEGDADTLFMLNIGLTIYDHFAGRTNPIPHRMYKRNQVLKLEPSLRAEGLTGGAIYADSRTDDGRLTLEVMQSAVQYGAAVANYVQVMELLKDGGGKIVGARAVDHVSGAEVEIRADRVLAAAGPWADAIRRLDDPGLPQILRTTKGVHLTLPYDRLPLKNAVVMHGRDGRMMFAVPSQPCTYVGTTDTDHEGDPADLTIDRDDVEYIIDATAHTFPEAGITTDDVIAGWVGVRPLLRPEGEKTASATSRDYKIFHNPSVLVTIGGGKLTAFRAMASRIVDDVFPATRSMDHLKRSIAPLPGAQGRMPTDAELDRLAADTGAPRDYVGFLADRYGSALPRVAAYLKGAAENDPVRAWLRARTRHAVGVEMALHLEDVLKRRTELMLFTRGNGLEHLEALADEMAALLGWSPDRRAEEVAACRKEVQAMFAWRDGDGKGPAAPDP